MNETITVCPKKGALLRVAFWKSKEDGFYQFEVGQTQYILLFSKARTQLKYYDLIVKQNNQKVEEKLQITRSEVIRSYFQDEMKDLNPNRSFTAINSR